MCVLITFQYNLMKNCDWPCQSLEGCVLPHVCWSFQGLFAGRVIPAPNYFHSLWFVPFKKKKEGIFGVIPNFPSPSPSVHFFTPVHWKKLLATHWQLKIIRTKIFFLCVCSRDLNDCKTNDTLGYIQLLAGYLTRFFSRVYVLSDVMHDDY